MSSARCAAFDALFRLQGNTGKRHFLRFSGVQVSAKRRESEVVAIFFFFQFCAHRFSLRLGSS